MRVTLMIVVLALCVAVVSGCAGSAKALPKVMKAVPEAPRVPAAQATKGWSMVATHTSGLDEGDSWTVVQAACMANDLVDMQQAPNFGVAVEQAWINFGGYQTLYYRVDDLAEDLRDASTEWERRYRVGVFVVCESSY